jgi:hypothetical protein
MRPPALGVRPKEIYSCAAGLLVPAFLFALFLALAPQMHQRIHGDSNDSSHECAATLFASASCLHTGGDLVKVEVRPPPPTPTPIPRRLSIFAVPVKMSILEHAPPAHS